MTGRRGAFSRTHCDEGTRRGRNNSPPHSACDAGRKEAQRWAGR